MTRATMLSLGGAGRSWGATCTGYALPHIFTNTVAHAWHWQANGALVLQDPANTCRPLLAWRQTCQ
eukprot:6226378-Prymnesium_polylepis.1